MLVFRERTSFLRRRNRTTTAPVVRVAGFDPRARDPWSLLLPSDRAVENRYRVGRRRLASPGSFESLLLSRDPVAHAAQHRCSFAGSVSRASPMMFLAQARGKALARAALGRPE